MLVVVMLWRGLLLLHRWSGTLNRILAAHLGEHHTFFVIILAKNSVLVKVEAISDTETVTKHRSFLVLSVHVCSRTVVSLSLSLVPLYRSLSPLPPRSRCCRRRSNLICPVSRTPTHPFCYSFSHTHTHTQRAEHPPSPRFLPPSQTSNGANNDRQTS